jgi:hypothetical protein
MREFIYGHDTPPPIIPGVTEMNGTPGGPPRPARQRPVHNGLAIAAFLVTFFVPPLGFILGCVSISEAHSSNRNASGLATWAVALGVLFTAITIIVVAVAVHSASAPVCDQFNPNWPYC